MESNNVSLNSSLGSFDTNYPPTLLLNEMERGNDHDATSRPSHEGEAIAAAARIHPHRTLNAIGLSCPMPLLRTKKEITSISSRQILEVLSTCPGARTSLPTWSERAGHRFLGAWEEDGILRSYIQKH